MYKGCSGGGGLDPDPPPEFGRVRSVRGFWRQQIRIWSFIRDIWRCGQIAFKMIIYKSHDTRTFFLWASEIWCWRIILFSIWFAMCWEFLIPYSRFDYLSICFFKRVFKCEIVFCFLLSSGEFVLLPCFRNMLKYGPCVYRDNKLV